MLKYDVIFRVIFGGLMILEYVNKTRTADISFLAT